MIKLSLDFEHTNYWRRIKTK